MRKERYHGQHDAQPSSSMILHVEYFYEPDRSSLFLFSSTNDVDNDYDNDNDDDDDADDKTDLVVSHSSLFYWQLLTAASRHWITSMNNVHIIVILS